MATSKRRKKPAARKSGRKVAPVRRALEVGEPPPHSLLQKRRYLTTSLAAAMRSPRDTRPSAIEVVHVPTGMSIDERSPLAPSESPERLATWVLKAAQELMDGGLDLHTPMLEPQLFHAILDGAKIAFWMYPTERPRKKFRPRPKPAGFRMAVALPRRPSPELDTALDRAFDGLPPNFPRSLLKALTCYVCASTGVRLRVEAEGTRPGLSIEPEDFRALGQREMGAYINRLLVLFATANPSDPPLWMRKRARYAGEPCLRCRAHHLEPECPPDPLERKPLG